jgi:hypothetical protein
MNTDEHGWKFDFAIALVFIRVHPCLSVIVYLSGTVAACAGAFL